MFHECSVFDSVLKKLHGVLMQFLGCLREISMLLKEYINGNSRLSQGCFHGLSKVLQGSFKYKLKGASKKPHVAWQSSQLHKQKEGLFYQKLLKNAIFSREHKKFPPKRSIIK